MLKIVYTLVMLAMIGSAAHAQEDAMAIRQLLKEQTECWNQGELDCFMQTYWKSDSLMYIGKKGVTYGWQHTLNNYKKNYPDKAAMGTLQFEILSMQAVEDDAYFVVGKWFLTREKGDINGHFSLLLRKMDDKWVIVADHSS